MKVWLVDMHSGEITEEEGHRPTLVNVNTGGEFKAPRKWVAVKRIDAAGAPGLEVFFLGLTAFHSRAEAEPVARLCCGGRRAGKGGA